jgi:hypothetical protein
MVPPPAGTLPAAGEAIAIALGPLAVLAFASALIATAVLVVGLVLDWREGAALARLAGLTPQRTAGRPAPLRERPAA